MHYVAIVTVIAFAELLWLGGLVSRARVRYGIAAPAVSGNEIFERHFRVHMNTLEQLVIFVPSMWIFAQYFNAGWAAALGVLFIIGRLVYARSYVRDPKSRLMGSLLTALPTLLFMIGIVWGAVRALLRG